MSKDRSAYAYLPATMAACPQGEEMVNIIRKAGFDEVKARQFTFGLSTLYTAAKPL
ncbi:MAG: class I SAM-dependent methyltransferase [Alloprevotella sp.]|nr:class I SAM-dependent methyltransferase [Alloprevotella sp.]